MAQKKAINYTIWQDKNIAQNFLEGVRGAIPLAAEQINCLLSIIHLTQPKVELFLDLGCGNGILGKAITNKYPDAQGIFMDISESMLEVARNTINNQEQKFTFLLQDFGTPDWYQTFDNVTSFDVIVSGFAIYHQPDPRKKEIYQEIYQLLRPGGIFLNLEHVASHSPLGEKAFDKLFVDALFDYHAQQKTALSRQEIEQQYYSRHDKNANILSLVEDQCHWLRETGFVDVDCFMKLFEIALFGGVKPK